MSDAGERALKADMDVLAEVLGIENDGILIQIKGNTLRAFIPRSQLAYDRNERHPERFAVGDEIKARVLAIDHALAKVTVSIREYVTPDELAEFEADQWRITLKAAWEQRFMSLSAAVHWIATRGEFREADYDELERAAKELLDRMAGGLQGFGRRPEADQQEEISPLAFRGIWPFFGDPAHFEGNAGKKDGLAPVLIWNPMLEPEKGDSIVRQDGTVDGIAIWLGLNVDRVSLQAIWPAQIEITDKRRQRGRPPRLRDKIAAKMLADLQAGKITDNEKRVALEGRYGASGETCMKAYRDALSKYRANKA
jgi:predicted RNA-binding protein with RPS1 domain